MVTTSFPTTFGASLYVVEVIKISGNMTDLAQRRESHLKKWPGKDRRADNPSQNTLITTQAAAVESQENNVTTRSPGSKRKAGTDLVADQRVDRPQPNSSVPPTADDEINQTTEQRCLPVWSMYDKGFEVDFGDGYFWLASKKESPLELVLVRTENQLDGETMSELSQKLQGEYFVKCFHALRSNLVTHLVFEFMNLSLVQITGAPRLPTEQEVLAIIGQVGVENGTNMSLVLILQLVTGLKVAKKSGRGNLGLHASRVWVGLNGYVKICWLSLLLDHATMRLTLIL